MKLGRSIKYSLELILLLIVILMCFLWWSLTTANGTKRLLSATQSRLQNLSYDYESGSLIDGFVLNEARWELKNGTSIYGQDLDITANPSCWQSKELCIEHGKIKKLVIRLPEGKATSEEIKLKDLSLLLSIRANSITVNELLVTHPARPPIVFNNAQLEGSISESEITLKHFTTEWNKLHLDGSGTITMQNNYPINMSGQATRALSSSTLLADWSASGNLKSLKLDTDFKKPFQAKLVGKVALLDRKRPADLSLSFDSIELPFNSKEPRVVATGGEIAITGNWPKYKTQGTANLDGPNIPQGTADLSGHITTGELSFSPLTIKTLNGTIMSDGEFSWKKGMRWQARVLAENLQPQLYWPKLNGLINANSEIEGVIGKHSNELRFNNINATGMLNEQPISLVGSVAKNTDQNWIVENLQLKSDSNNASANGVLGDSIKLVFNMNSIQNLVPNANGSLNGDLTLEGDINTPTIEGSITTANFHYNDFTLRNARINGVARELGAKQSDIQFQAASLKIKDRVFEQPNLTFDGSLSNHSLQLKTKSTPLDLVSINIKGGKDKNNNWRGSVNSAKGTMANRLLSLVNPFTARWDNNQKTLAVAPHCWTYEFASVCVEKSALIGKTGVVQFALNRLPLESIREFTPEALELSGNLRSKGNVKWGPNQTPMVTVESHLEGATAIVNKTINNKKLKMAFDVAELNITTEGQKISTQLRMESDKFSTLTANIDINTAISTLPIQGTASLDNSQLNWIKDFLPDVNQFAGKLKGNAAISGTLTNPTLNGDLQLQDGHLLSSLVPVDITGINLGVRIAGNKAHIKGNALANDAKVAITGTGSIGKTGISSDINLAGDKIKIQHQYAKHAILSPNLDFKIRPKRIDISGKVDIPSAQIIYQTDNTQGVALSDDVIVTDNNDSPLPSARVGSTGVSTRLNISLGDDVSVEAFGLNADLTGAFQLALESEKPLSLLGRVAVADGNYRAYGQKLKIRDGKITFTGPIQQTTLAVEAVRETKDVLAGVRIRGTLQNPSTSLFSEPSINEDDILSYIVLGRKLNFNESDDTGILQKAALMLGIDTGQKVSSGLARSLGIDDFSLSAWGTGDDTQILVSGKLSDRLLLRYGVGVFKNNNTLYLRYDLAEKFYLETTHGLDSAVDVFYSFDF